MIRRMLVDILLENSQSVTELAKRLKKSPKDIQDDLVHLQRSLKHLAFRMIIDPAKCRKCGFKFKKDKLNKPSKCPKCYSTWIDEPLISIERK